MTGEKYDEGKPLAGLVLMDFARALQAVVEVGTYGAKKYEERGWLSVPMANKRYTDALWRHLLANAHTQYDEESNLEHLAHAAWNILALLELRRREK